MADDSVRLTRFENGLRVVTETSRDVASVALGVWLDNGSRDECERTQGISHFVEHLVFKGTPTRSARRIAEDIESLGGTINAFTGKEHTCFHTRTLHEHMPVAVDVLADIFLNASLRSDDIELEREVIVQEILEVEDTPEDFIHDFHLGAYWPGHPLAWPVTGTTDSVERIGRDDVAEFVRERHRPDRVIVAAAGRVDHDELVALCRERLGALAPSGHERAERAMPELRPGLYVARRELEQVHLLFGLPGLSVTDPRREQVEILIAALGGGMSSRLFQAIREERGKAYEVYAFGSPFADCGYTGVYAATGPDSVAEVCDLVCAELRAVCREGLAPAELERTKRQLIGSIPLALETTDARMSRIVRNQLYFDRPVPLAEVVADIEAVTNADIIELARELLALERMGTAVVGDVDDGAVALPLG